MRIAVLAAAICLSVASLAATPGADASVRKTISIPAQGLGPALQALAKERELHVVFVSEDVSALRTEGISGNLTTTEALNQLLSGTGLTYQYIDSTTVSILPTASSTVQPRVEVPSASESLRLAQAATSEEPSPSKGEGQGEDQKQTVEESKDSSGSSSKGIPEILVQGSRAMNVDVVRGEDDVQPYTILEARQIERSGATTVEGFLKAQLTMNTAGPTNSQVLGSFSGTTSAINLRGLGANETLVLINGRRSAGVVILGVNNQTDINAIPLSAVERIEVLPSSASAIYGGAAVGGVVNIVLKKDFEGGAIGYIYDTPAGTSAHRRTVNGSYGMTFGGGRTQVMFGGQYAEGSPLLLGDREDLLNRGFSRIFANSPSYFNDKVNPFQGRTTNISSVPRATVVPAGTTGATCFGTFCFIQQSPNLTLKPVLGGASLGSPITHISEGAVPGADIASGLRANAGAYNLNFAPSAGTYGLRSSFGSEPRTHSMFATVRQSLSDSFQVFTELSTSSNAGRGVSSPFSGSYRVPTAAPTNPFQQDVFITFPSSLEPRRKNDSATRSATLGVVGVLAYGWSAELDYTWSRNIYDVAFNSGDSTAITAALRAGAINPFVDTIASPLDLSSYLAPATYSGRSTLSDMALRASGPLGSLYAGAVTLTVGLEHRREATGDATYRQEFPLTPTVTRETVYFGQSQSTDSIYTEALVPLVAPANGVRAVRSIDLQVATRVERYTVHAGTPFEYVLPVSSRASNPPQGVSDTIEYTSTSPTIGLKYQPLTGLTARVSFATAFLPPTVGQLLLNPTPVCSATPCAPITDPVTGQAYLVNYTSGGNPDLSPQTSRNWDFGFIWEPQQEALRGFRANVQYYRIEQPNYITNPTPQQLVANPEFSSRVTRDPGTGRVTVVDARPLNATVYKTSGWDLKLAFQKPTAYGEFAFQAAGSWIRHDLRQYAIGSPEIEYADYPNDGGVGKIKSYGSLSWQRQGWSAAWTANYYSSYQQVFSPGSPSYIQSGANPIYIANQGGTTVPSQLYHDLNVGYVFAIGAGRRDAAAGNSMWPAITLNLGVRNVFNTLPPFDAYFAPYFYSPYGDPRLREYRLALKVAF